MNPAFQTLVTTSAPPITGLLELLGHEAFTWLDQLDPPLLDHDDEHSDLTVYEFHTDAEHARRVEDDKTITDADLEHLRTTVREVCVLRREANHKNAPRVLYRSVVWDGERWHSYYFDRHNGHSTTYQSHLFRATRVKTAFAGDVVARLRDGAWEVGQR